MSQVRQGIVLGSVVTHQNVIPSITYFTQIVTKWR